MSNSINRAADFFGPTWPASGAIPESLSSAGWTLGNEGYEQQTFLGCSIRDFTISAGFGDSSSTLNVSLVPDEFNVSDRTGYGLGDDVYHSGNGDLFVPPPVGSPVFFKFGKNKATVEQAWRSTLDRTYGYDTSPIEPLDLNLPVVASGLEELADGVVVDLENSDITNDQYALVDNTKFKDPDYSDRGRDHLVFAGILQSYGQSSSSDGDPLYNAVVVDPREILSNATMILNNYSESTYGLPNLFNVFGFLEYNTTLSLADQLEAYYNVKSQFRKVVNEDGSIDYLGGFDPVNRINYPQLTDTYTRQDYLNTLATNTFDNEIADRLLNNFPNVLPITGTSFSRRTEKGIPFYRIVQALNAMMGYYGDLPSEYVEKGFGATINFRGFNYVVDFSGIPIDRIPNSFFIDFDQMTLMEFVQEVTDVISHELFVSLIPIIDHPATRGLFTKNQNSMMNNNPQDIIAGVIRIDCIDRSVKPNYGSIKLFIESIKQQGLDITSADEGYELSNVSTDKFVVGAQEVGMHFFTNNNDRDELEVRKAENGLPNRLGELLGGQWLLSQSLSQQILPFYGFLGKDCVSIPRGFGSYQQIMLDSSGLEANGVGNYYVATEMELRAASISYESWRDFLLQYDTLYLESAEPDDLFENAVLKKLDTTDVIDPLQATIPVDIAKDYAVTVPRSVFASEMNYTREGEGGDGLPASPCNPPFGYPLYYKRATKIGMPESGLTAFAAKKSRLIADTNKIRNMAEKGTTADFKKIQTAWKDILKNTIGMGPEERAIVEEINAQLDSDDIDPNKLVSLIETKYKTSDYASENASRLNEKHSDNVMKVYEFVKAAADNLGKKFLVKMPRMANPFYSRYISLKGQNSGGDKTQEEKQAANLRVNELIWGPFGFKPRSISPNPNFQQEAAFNQDIYTSRSQILAAGRGVFETMLSYGLSTSSVSVVGTNGRTEPAAVYPNLDVTQGAIRGSYNTLSDSHQFNYEPEPQGGFIEFDLYQNIYTQGDLDLIQSGRNRPAALEQLLFPIDMTNFMTEDSRMGCYVRFDNSQFHNFSSIPSDQLSQQSASGGVIIPDITTRMENTREDKIHDFPNKDFKKSVHKKDKSVAFVRASLDSRFYMPPKLVNRKLSVFGRTTRADNTYSPSRRTWNSGECRYDNSLQIYTPVFSPGPFGGQDDTFVDQEDFLRVGNNLFEGDLINTYPEFQDNNHVYALITLPGKIQSTIDTRYGSGPFQDINPSQMMHLLHADTVKGVEGFEMPATKTQAAKYDPINFCTSEKLFDKFTVTEDQKKAGWIAFKEAMKGISKTKDNLINWVSPSPIYPSLVAIPLRSNERCYGPWVSSFSNSNVEAQLYSNIPGKIDFVKDESLSPWGYNGYDLMNEAGLLQAEFSNSLLLFSEKGTISYAGMPSGNALSQPLMLGGPLVTNIDVSISATAGINTTYQMSLYTPSFGKLQKQKQDMIAKISRERQKLQDERNDLIRKGIGKGQKVANYEILNQKLSGINGLSSVGSSLTQRLDANAHATSVKVASVDFVTEEYINPVTKETSKRRVKRAHNSVENKEFIRTIESLGADENAAVRMAYNSSTEDNSEAVSLSPLHQNLPNFKEPSRDHYG